MISCPADQIKLLLFFTEAASKSEMPVAPIRTDKAQFG